MNIEILITIIISIVILRIYFSLPDKHNFWEKQPVMRTYNYLGKIGYCPSFEIRCKDFSWEFPMNGEKLIGFLNENFSKYYKFPIEIGNYLLKTNRIITLGYNNEIVGSITYEPIIVKIGEKVERMYFVDNLCVHRKFRRKNLASILISKLINKVVNKEGPMVSFIFKIDGKPLPFLEITKSNYYYRELNKPFISKNFSIQKRTFFIQNLIGKNEKYVRISPGCKENGYVFLEEDGIGVRGRVSEFMGRVVYDIDYIEFMEEDEKLDREKWERIEGKLRENGIEIVTLVGIGYNSEIIENSNWEMANGVYWYFYNYSCHKITKNDFYVNYN